MSLPVLLSRIFADIRGIWVLVIISFRNGIPAANSYLPMFKRSQPIFSYPSKMALALKISDFGAVFSFGKKVIEDEASRILSDKEISKLYLGG